jgi:hypothetical protein
MQHRAAFTFCQYPLFTDAGSADGLQAFGADRQCFLDRALPPVGGREDLDFDRPRIAGCLDHRPDAGNVDDAVAHHAPVGQEIRCGHQPVADMEAEDPVLPAGPCDLPGKLRVPPDMIDVDGDAQQGRCRFRLDGFGQIQGLLQRVAWYLRKVSQRKIAPTSL